MTTFRTAGKTTEKWYTMSNVFSNTYNLNPIDTVFSKETLIKVIYKYCLVSY